MSFMLDWLICFACYAAGGLVWFWLTARRERNERRKELAGIRDLCEAKLDAYGNPPAVRELLHELDAMEGD